MPQEVCSWYKGIRISVLESHKPGYYQFRFEIAGHAFRGRVQTRLPGIAVHRARRAIDRKLREMHGSS
jgi:hypothetical protein